MYKTCDLADVKCRLIEEEEIFCFAEGVNLAFEARSGERIPFEPETMGSFLKKYHQGYGFFAIFNSENMVGGLMFNDMGEGNTKISKVWVGPEYQGNDLAKKMLLAAEDHLRTAGVRFVYLSVANIYQPAYQLYKKCGYQKIGITANVPETYYFVDMIKPLTDKVFPKKKRIRRYAVSWIKFHLLFDKYSTPNFIHKLLFR